MIVDKIRHNAVLFPNKEALVYGETSMNYKELMERLDAELALRDTEVNIINIRPIDTLIKVLASNSVTRRSLVLPKDFNATLVPDIQEVASQAFIGILSSGTDGEPRVIWKTNDNWETAFKHQSTIFGLNKGDRVFVLDALSYSANLNAALHALWQGCTLVLGKLGEAKHWNRQMDEQNISSFFLVPSHCRLLTKTVIENLRINSIITAGEKLDISTAKTLMDQFPEAILTEYYGASELGHISYHQNHDIVNYPHSVGKAFPKVSIQVVNEKVEVRSPYVSREYIEIGTVNDLGYFEEDRLILKGRAGRVFNRRGLNIYAQEIENAALNSVIVSEVALVQLSNKRLHLYFTSKSPGNANEKLLAQFLNEYLPAAKRPNSIKQIREIPHSEAGKVDFKALSKMSEERGHAII